MSDILTDLSLGFILSWLIFAIGMLLSVYLFFRVRIWRILKTISFQKPLENHRLGLSIATALNLSLGGVVGMSTAIAIGGPGSVFWVWVFGLFAILIKFCEGKIFTSRTGAPYLDVADRWKQTVGGKIGPIGSVFSIAVVLISVLSSFVLGSVMQSNVAAVALESVKIPLVASGILIAASVIALGLFESRISKIMFSKIFPGTLAIYLLLCLVTILINIVHIPDALVSIFTDAFSGMSAASGIVGSVITVGFTQMVWSSQSTLGISSLVAAEYQDEPSPLKSGQLAALQPIISIYLIGTLTALVIVCSGNFGNERYLSLVGSSQVKNQPVYLGSGWRTSSNTLHPETDSMKHLSTPIGQYQFQPIADSIGILEIQDLSKIANGTLIPDGVRFSSWEHQVRTEVRLLDSHSDLLAAAYVPNQLDHPDAAGLMYNGVEIASITPKGTDGKWNSHLIKFSKPEIAHLLAARQSESISVQLVGYGSAGSEWVVNRIEPVVSESGVHMVIRAMTNKLGKLGLVSSSIILALISVSGLLAWYSVGSSILRDRLSSKWTTMVYLASFSSLAIVGSAVAIPHLIKLGVLVLSFMVIPIAAFLLFSSKPIVTDPSAE